MKPKWLTKQESYRTKSDKRVKKIAKRTGGKVVSNSGATWFEKGDISYGASLLEHKMTEKDSFKLNKAVLYKTRKEAIKAGKKPFVMIDFGDIFLVGQVFKGGVFK